MIIVYIHEKKLKVHSLQHRFVAIGLCKESEYDDKTNFFLGPLTFFYVIYERTNIYKT